MPHAASTQTIGGVYAQQAERSAAKRRQKQRGLKDVCCALKKSGTQAQWLTGTANRRRKNIRGAAGGDSWRVRMLCVWLLPGRGVIHTVVAAARVAAHSAPVLKTAARTPLVALDRWEPPPIDPFKHRTGPPVDLSGYRWRRALLKVCVVLACSVFFLRGGGAKRMRPPPVPMYLPSQTLGAWTPCSVHSSIVWTVSSVE